MTLAVLGLFHCPTQPNPCIPSSLLLFNFYSLFQSNIPPNKILFSGSSELPSLCFSLHSFTSSLRKGTEFNHWKRFNLIFIKNPYVTRAQINHIMLTVRKYNQVSGKSHMGMSCVFKCSRDKSVCAPYSRQLLHTATSQTSAAVGFLVEISEKTINKSNELQRENY